MADGDQGVVTLFLIRHGHVDSHEGDVPLTTKGEEAARRAGECLAQQIDGPLLRFSGQPLRARQTTTAMEQGLRARCPRLLQQPSGVALGLRNPDLYLSGQRIEMVSTAEALAEQVAAVTSSELARHPFFGRFLVAADRVGWWLSHASPPGEDAPAVAARVQAFGHSLVPVGPTSVTVLGVTHSPVLRAVGLTHSGADPGEPGYLRGYRIVIAKHGYANVTPITLA